MAGNRDQVFYEQPLNERVRSFLRLEFLLERAHYHLKSDGVWACRATLDVLIDIMSIIGRIDLKKELIAELERHAATLNALARNPKVDQGRLEQVLVHVRQLLDTLRLRNNVLRHELRSHELLNAIRQRSTIPAGTCDFDLPHYHHWLKHSPEIRNRDLREWVENYDLLNEAVTLCLQLVRESAVATSEVADSGFFQRTLDTAGTCHMIRVALARECTYYPEVSAGKHRFSVRFMQSNGADVRSTQTSEDVAFDLLCCVL